MINSIVSVVCVTYTMLVCTRLLYMTDNKSVNSTLVGRLQGGVKAVIWTDVMQAFVMVFALLMIMVCAVMRIGGISETIDRVIEGGRLFPPL